MMKVWYADWYHEDEEDLKKALEKDPNNAQIHNDYFGIYCSRR